MRVINYEAHNVMKIKDITFDLDGHHLFIVGGKNANGKSSALKALLIALCGRSGMDYPEPALREGEDEGWVRVKLSGDMEFHEPDHFIVELYLKRRRDGSVAEQFRILDSCGEEAPSPRKLLQSLYNAKAFDPLAFDRMDKKQRRETLLKLVGLDLESFRDRRKEIFDKRTEVNREGVREKAKFDAMPFFEGVPSEPVNVSKIIDEMQTISARNDQIKKAKESWDLARSLADKQRSDIELIEKKLSQLKSDLAKSEKDIVSCEAAMLTIGEFQEVEDLHAQLRSAGEINEKVSMNQRRESAESELTALREQSSSLTDQLKSIDKEQDDAIKTAKWPVSDLAVDDEGVLYRGLPIESASQAERISVSIEVGIALHPKLQLFVSEDGSALDDTTLSVLEAKLKANGYQMIVELVTRTQEDENLCAVVISDGTVKKKGTKAP